MQTIIRYGKQFIQYVRNNQAVAALEYALLIGAVVIVAVVALTQLGSNVAGVITDANTAVTNAKAEMKTAKGS